MTAAPPKTVFAQLVWQCGKSGLRVGLLLEPPVAALGTKERAKQARLQIIVCRSDARLVGRDGVDRADWCSAWVEAGAELETAARALLTTLAGKGLIA